MESRSPLLVTMTRSKPEEPPSPPIFRPWQLDLPSTPSQPGKSCDSPCVRESVSHLPSLQKVEDQINAGASVSRPTGSGSLKRRLEEDADDYVGPKFLKVEDFNVKKSRHCVEDVISEVSRPSERPVEHCEGPPEASKLLGQYLQYHAQNGSGSNMPLFPAGFPLTNPYPVFPFIPAVDRYPPYSGPPTGTCPSVMSFMSRGFIGNNRPGPSVLPGFEGPLVPLMDYLVPAAEVERVCAKRPRPKRFSCHECRSAFSNKGQLKGHLRIHTGERPFACGHPGCGKKFTRNEELTRHRRIHSGARPFPCPLCDKRFGRKDHLKKHIRTHQRQAVVPAEPLLLQHLHHLQQMHHRL